MRRAPHERRRDRGSAVSSRWRTPALLVAAALGILVYLNALDNPFVYDDHDTVVANPSLADPSNIRYVLVYSPFRPVINVSYAIDRVLWGHRPFGFHLTNVLLHAAVVALLYSFLVRAIEDVSVRTGRQRNQGADIETAFVGAAIFAVHPLMTEAVGYVSGRSEVLCGLFYLAALLCGRAAMLSQVNTAEQAGIVSSRSRYVMIAGAVVCGVLAMLSKEIGATLPFVLALYDWLILPSDDASRWRRLRLVFLPMFLLMVAAAAYRIHAYHAAGPATPVRVSLAALLTQSIVMWRYVRLFLVPAGQSIMHGVQAASGIVDPRAVMAIAGLVIVGVMAFRLRRVVPLLTFGIFWWLIVLAPSSSVLGLREGMAEHRVYVASAGIVIVLTALMSRVLTAGASARGRLPAFGGLAAAGVIALLSILTIARNDVWASPVRLWTEATEAAPGLWEPHYALADTLRESGDCASAVHEYEAVVRIRPDHRDAYTNLGICLAQTDRLDEADAAFNRALAIDPGFARVHTNLAALALMRGDWERARGHYLKAIELDPANVLARMQLAGLYERAFHDYHAAARMCGEARAIAPYTRGVVECVERNQKLAAARDGGR